MRSSGFIGFARVCSASGKRARAGRWTTSSVAPTARVPENPCSGGLDASFVCCAKRPQMKQELQLAPTFAWIEHEGVHDGVWSRHGCRFVLSSWSEREWFEPQASTTRRGAILCFTGTFSSFSVRTGSGHHWLFETKKNRPKEMSTELKVRAKNSK